MIYIVNTVVLHIFIEIVEIFCRNVAFATMKAINDSTTLTTSLPTITQQQMARLVT